MKLALILVTALAGFNLQANTIIATFNGELTSEAIQRNVGDGWYDNTTGMFSFTRTGGTQVGAPLGTFYAFCIEPREFVSPGNSYQYDFSDLPQGATNIGGMGAAKADLLRELFGRARRGDRQADQPRRLGWGGPPGPRPTPPSACAA